MSGRARAFFFFFFFVGVCLSLASEKACLCNPFIVRRQQRSEWPFITCMIHTSPYYSSLPIDNTYTRTTRHETHTYSLSLTLFFSPNPTYHFHRSFPLNRIRFVHNRITSSIFFKIIYRCVSLWYAWHLFLLFIFIVLSAEGRRRRVLRVSVNGT